MAILKIVVRYDTDEEIIIIKDNLATSSYAVEYLAPFKDPGVAPRDEPKSQNQTRPSSGYTQ